MILNLGQLHHDIRALLLRHSEHRRNLQPLREPREVDVQKAAILIKRHGRNLDYRPAACSALLIALHQCRTGGTCGDDLCIRLHIVYGFQPFIPILSVLHFIKKIVSILLSVDVFVVAFQDIIETTELQHRVVHGDKHDLLRRNAPLQ